MSFQISGLEPSKFAHLSNLSDLQLAARGSLSSGYDIVLLPMPGHDENPDNKLGFGLKESKLI